MLTTVRLVLRLNAAVGSLEQSSSVISRFLGPPPNLPLHKACQFGSTALLDWVWSACCTRAVDRTPGLALTNFLRFDPHYHKLQFSKSLQVAAGRGDLAMVQWIFTHFSGCEAPATVADEAKKKGHLLVLRLLWEHKSGDESQDTDHQSCYVRFDDGGSCWTDETIREACENGQLAQCLDEGLRLNEAEEEVAIKHAIDIGKIELAQRLVPLERSIFDYVSGCTRVEVIEWLLECGYMQRNKRLAVSTMPPLARAGRVDLLQSITKLYSRFPRHHEYCVSLWIDALEMACRYGHLPAVQLLVAHPLWNEVCECIKSERICLLSAVAEGGNADVMEFLHSHGLIVEFLEPMDAAISNGQASSIKWLLEHYAYDFEVWNQAIFSSVQNGHLEVLKLFHELDSSTPYTRAASKRRRMNEAYSWPAYPSSDLMYWAAEGGHLEVLKWFQATRAQKCGPGSMDVAAAEGHLDVVKWLHQNSSEGCTEDAIREAAANGHLEVVKWLHQNRSVGGTKDAMKKAELRCHLEVVKWLHANCSERCAEDAMCLAARAGQLRMVQWLYVNIPETRTSDAIDRALHGGHFRVVCWLQRKFPGYRAETAVLSSDGRLISVCMFRRPAESLFERILFLHECCNSVFLWKSYVGNFLMGDFEEGLPLDRPCEELAGRALPIMLNSDSVCCTNESKINNRIHVKKKGKHPHHEMRENAISSSN